MNRMLIDLKVFVDIEEHHSIPSLRRCEDSLGKSVGKARRTSGCAVVEPGHNGGNPLSAAVHGKVVTRTEII